MALDYDWLNSSINGLNLNTTPIEFGASPALNPALYQIPNVGGSTGGGFGAQMGGPLGITNAALSGLSTIGNIWNGFQALNLAKKQFRQTRDITNANLNNQIQSYNTALSDRIRSRAAVEGMTPEAVNNYLNENKLRRNTSGS